MNGVVDGFFRFGKRACHIRIGHITDVESENGLFEIRERLVDSSIQMAKRFFTDDEFFRGIKIGFAESEIDLALENGLQPVTLGKRILRTETAGMFVLSAIGFALEA